MWYIVCKFFANDRTLIKTFSHLWLGGAPRGNPICIDMCIFSLYWVKCTRFILQPISMWCAPYSLLIVCLCALVRANNFLPKLIKRRHQPEIKKNFLFQKKERKKDMTKLWSIYIQDIFLDIQKLCLIHAQDMANICIIYS